MPRAVLDTGVTLVGFFGHGPERELIEAANAGDIELISSDALVAELMRALATAAYAPTLDAASTLAVDLASEYAELSKVVLMPKSRSAPGQVAHPAVACAKTARADYLVTNDPELLAAGAAEGIPLVSPETALRRT